MEWTQSFPNQSQYKTPIIRFDLTNISNLKGVLNGRAYPNAITTFELQYLRANWTRFQNNTIFYRNDIQVPAPWETGPGTWYPWPPVPWSPQPACPLQPENPEPSTEAEAPPSEGGSMWNGSQGE